MTENMTEAAKSLPGRLRKMNIPVLCFFLILCLYLALNWGNYNKLPWQTAVEGASFSSAARGYEGEYYAIDSGGARLLSFGENGVFRWDAASDATLGAVAAADSGRVYVTSYVFDDNDRIIQADILEYNRRGRRVGTLLSRSYEGAEDTLPMYTSGYLSLVSAGQWLYYMEKHPSDLTLYRIDAGSETPAPEVLSVFPYPDAEALTLGAACDPETGAAYTADKFGVIRELSLNGAHKELPYPARAEAGFSLPFGLYAGGGTLYVSDVGRRQMYRLQDGAFEPAADLGGDMPLDEDFRLYYWINGAPEGEILLISQYGLIRYGGGGLESLGASFVFDGIKRLTLWLWWISAGVMAAGALVLVCRIFMYAYRKVGMERLMYSLMLTVVVTVVTVLVMAQYSDSFNKRFSNTTIDNLSALSAMTAAAVDGDALSRINRLEDYRGADYEKLKAQLAPVRGGGTWNMLYEDGEFRPDAADWDNGIYRMLIRVVDGRVYYVYSSADQWGALYPVDYPYEGTEFQIAYEQDVQIVFPSVVDFSGEYTYTVTPILDSRGDVAGALEMGVNLRAFRREMLETLREVALRAAVTVCEVLLLLNEIIFAAGVFRNRAAKGKKGLADVGAVRPLMFLLYLLDCFALVVSPLFARDLYTETLGIPMEVGVAIAYSATFFFSGAASAAGGRAAGRFGLFPLLIAGTAFLFGGELAAMASGNLWMFTAAKSLMGVGVGLVQYCADVIAAAQKDPRDVEHGFSMSNVGYNSGTNCGLVTGTAIGLLWGYRSVYLASALIALLMLAYILLIYRSSNLPDTKGVRRRAGGGFVRFAAAPGVLGFFLLIMFPYMLCNAFAYYFLPLAGTAGGMGEENISRIIFAYGLVSIYVGPALTRRLLDVFKVRTALAMGGLLIMLALLIYALKPGLTVLAVSVAIFAIADSFSFTVQSVYFSRLPETAEYGSGAALGVNNVMSGLAQSLSSYCFAAALVLGTGTGLGVIGAGMGVLLILFLVTTQNKKRIKAGVS
ncbi:MAG: MFS transporter [Peptococcaceae bacterium]|nr:MFS transporter [Peptococcaceae bacterium]